MRSDCPDCGSILRKTGRRDWLCVTNSHGFTEAQLLESMQPPKPKKKRAPRKKASAE